MLGAVFSAVAGFVYKRHKSRKTAILGAIAGAAVMAVFSTLIRVKSRNGRKWDTRSACGG